MKKIDGVESVKVTLNNGLVAIQLASGNHVTMASLRKVITSNGFSPREATVVVDGTVSDQDGALALTVTGTSETLVLDVTRSATGITDTVRTIATDGARAEVSGRIDAPSGTGRLSIESVKRLPSP